MVKSRKVMDTKPDPLHAGHDAVHAGTAAFSQQCIFPRLQHYTLYFSVSSYFILEVQTRATPRQTSSYCIEGSLAKTTA